MATDRAMIEVLGESPAAGDPFEDVRRRLADVMQRQPPRARLPWHGGPMTVKWALQNRLAVTWTLLDRLGESLGTDRPAPSRHIVELALDLLPHSFLRAGRAAPEPAVAVELVGPKDGTWTLSNRTHSDWPAPTDRVTGPALDLCRLACGRTTRGATALVASGDVADTWLDVVDALAYSDPPT
jgi:hypothetical protein